MEKSLDGIKTNRGGLQEKSVQDLRKRYFLKALGVVGLSAFVFSLFPKKASALIFGSGSRTADPVGLKNISGTVVNPATEETLQDTQYPRGAGANASVTLTLANTAYSLPNSAPAKAYNVVAYNVSDTDMNWGYAALTTGGILFPSGGTISVNLGSSQVLYVYCTLAGKDVLVTTKLIN